MTTRVGVIGCGQWGPNHIRNFSHLPNSKAVMCADTDAARLKAMKETFLNIIPTQDYREILKSKEVDAVCVAAPTAAHYSIVREALEAGKDVLCEKPLAIRAAEVSELVELASSRGRILMVGHVFLFNAGIQRLKEYIKNGDLGRIQYAHSVLTNLGPFRYDVNALFDLAPHDISIFNYLFNGLPIEVSARGHACLSKEREDLAFVTLLYPSDILVNLHVSWIDPRKVRNITIVGDKKMVCWDDLAPAGPIQLYDKRVERNMPYYETFGEFQLLSKEGDITIPKVNMWEPLKAQDAYFLDCVEKRKKPEMADGIKGLEVVRVLEAAQESISKRGVPVRIV